MTKKTYTAPAIDAKASVTSKTLAISSALKTESVSPPKRNA